MPTVRLDVDARGAERGLQTYQRSSEKARRETLELAKATRDAQKAVQSIGQVRTQGAARETARQAQALDRQAKAAQRASRAATDLERQQKRQLNTGLTLLSTLGGEERAFAQLTRAQIRQAEATGQNARVSERLAEVQRRVRGASTRMNETFSTQAVNSRDLRRNMRGLNQAMTRLQQGSILLLGPLSGVGARINTIGAAASQGGIAAVGFAAALAGGAGLLVAAVKTAQSLDDLQKRADRLGVTFEELQELQFVGARQGVQNINKAFDVFVKRIGEAEQGSGEAQNAIEALGLSMAELEGRTPIAQLELVAARFAEVETATQRNAIAADLFSRANQDMAQALVLGAEGLRELRARARELGIVLDEEAGRQAEVTVDRLTELGFIARQAGRQIVSDLLPALERVTEEAVSAAVEFANLVESLSAPLGERSLRSINAEIERMEGRLEAVRESLILVQGVGGIGAAVFEAVTGQDVIFEIDEITDRLEELRRARDRLLERQPQRDLADALGVTPEAFRAASRAGAASASEAAQAFEDLRLQLDEAAAAQEKYREAQATVNRAVEAGVVTQAEANAVLALARAEYLQTGEVAETRAEAERAAALAVSQTASGLAQKAADLREEIAATREGEAALRALTQERFVEQAVLEAMPRLLELSGEARAREVERIREQAREVARLQAELAQVQEEARSEAKRTTRQLDAQAQQRERLLAKPFETAAEGMQRAFRDSFRSVFDEGIDGFSDFGDRVLDLMKDLAAEIAALLVFRPILQSSGLGGILQGGQGGLSGILGGGQGLNLGSVTQLLGSIGSLFGLGGGSLAGATFSGPVSLQGALQSSGISGLANPNAPLTLSSGINLVLSNAGLGILGGVIGSEIARELELARTPEGSQFGSIGSSVGATAGAIAGSILAPGLGTVLGALVGSIFGSSSGGAIQAILAGDNPLLTQDTSDFERALQGGLRGFTLGGVGAGLSQISPSLGGIGGLFSAVPGLGFLIGAGVNLFAGGAPSKSTLQVRSGTGEGRQAFETPFGQFSVRGKNTGVIPQVRSLDEFLAQFLVPEEIEQASQAFLLRQGITQSFGRFDNEAVALAIDRIDTVLQAITSAPGNQGRGTFQGAPVSQVTRELIEGSGIREFSDEDFRRITQALLPRVEEFLRKRLELRAKVTGFLEAPLEEIGRAIEPPSEVEQALKDVNDTFNSLAHSARQLHFQQQFLLEIEEGRAKAIRLLRGQFEEDIGRRILEITEPFEAASRALAEEQQQRLSDAEALGADITEVERLNLLEREQLVEEFYGRANDQIRSFLEQLPTSQVSPLAPEAQLEQAETRFQQLVSAARGGDVDARGSLAQAAQTLLDASREVFASSDLFVQRFDFVTRTLESVLGDLPDPNDLPGFQHGGRFTVGGSGAPDGTLVAFRATRGESVTVAPSGEGQSRIDRLLEEIGRETAGGNSELSGLLEEILTELKESRIENASLRRRLDRLLAKQVA